MFESKLSTSAWMKAKMATDAQQISLVITPENAEYLQIYLSMSADLMKITSTL